MSWPSKTMLRDALTAHLADELQRATAAHRETHAGATHSEARPEGSKDTRALEQSYLARGQAMRAEELRLAIAEVARMPVEALADDAPAQPGALLRVREDDVERTVWLALHGGGLVLAGGTVLVVTPVSPLGRAIVGQCAGDVCELAPGSRMREIEIVAVR